MKIKLSHCSQFLRMQEVGGTVETLGGATIAAVKALGVLETIPSTQVVLPRICK